MLFSRIVAVASIIAGAAAKLTIRSTGPNQIEKTYLFELENDNTEAATTSSLQAMGIQVSHVRQRMNSRFFKGFSATLSHDNEEALATLPKVKNIYRVHSVPRAKPIIASADDNGKWAPEAIHSLTGVNQVRKQFGLTGKGIKVAVIDSGVDYMHEALGGGFGPGYRVSFGYDLVGDDYSASNTTTVPDADPIDNCSDDSHGTHVAGIVGADATNLKNPEWISQVPFTGVAPEVTLGAYRVFGCPADNTGTDVITNAIIMAAEDGADIINLSIGGGPVYNDGPDAEAASRVSAEGHFVFASHGNDGAEGIMVGGSPGVAAGGFGIASFDNIEAPKPFFTFNGEKFEYNPGSNNNDWITATPYEIVANDIDAEDKDNQEDGLHEINPAVKGKMALIRWGDIGFSNKRCTAAAKAGAIACILYANRDTVPNIAGSALIPSMATTNAAGKAIVAAIKAAQGKAVTTLVSTDLGIFKLPTAGSVSDFSSPGLDQELNLKPDFGGIGGQVFSTVSKHVQEVGKRKTPYAVYSGTSMSSPYTAGLAALVLQAAGRNRPTFDELRTLLQNTANFAKKYNTNLIDSVAYQGAGLINAYQAVTSKVSVYPSRLALNDTQYTQQHYKLTVTNKNTVPVTYTVKHVPALQVNPFKAGDDVMLTAADQTYTAEYATIKFSKNNDRVDNLEFTLKAGESKSFNVHAQPPSTAVAGLFPVYSGYIVVDVDGDKVASVPYAGVVGKWRDSPVFVRKSEKLDTLLKTTVAPAYTATFGAPVAANASITTGVFSIDNFGIPIPSNQVYNLSSNPLVVLSVPATTNRVIRVEAVYKGDKWSTLDAIKATRWTQLHIVGNPVSLNPAGAGLDVPETVNIATSYNPQRISYNQGQSVARPTMFLWQGAVITNVTDPNAEILALPAGKYQIRFAGLKHFGRTNAPVGGSDFDTINSNTFEIVY
ncbi:hypothetical protein HDU97_004437 [Phlyctochytrium planicorne]|nr:hypothetical protein HDU97_004437 [Phlyctochytrium planicorne]